MVVKVKAMASHKVTGSRKQMVSLEEVVEENGQNGGLRPPIDVPQKTKSGDEQQSQGSGSGSQESPSDERTIQFDL
jgi:hypothetical protein